jgi:hypothetical protein
MRGAKMPEDPGDIFDFFWDDTSLLQDLPSRQPSYHLRTSAISVP